MDERVFFAAAPDYSQDMVDAAVERLLHQLPAAALLAPGKKVLLKPNLLSGTAPEKAVTPIRRWRRRSSAPRSAGAWPRRTSPWPIPPAGPTPPAL